MTAGGFGFVKATKARPAPVFMGGFSKSCGENPLHENCLHRAPGNFRVIFVAADAALLTQGKDNKAKSAEKGRHPAVREGLSSP
ncbi:MAG TPA: hypothetical protein VN369_08395 [Terriglobales bacterium]|nr:hypothetical protein [Terriglobales bacterium]